MGRKGLCRLSNNYNIQHIRQVGLNCPFKHKTYHWPAKICSNHCILGDSIVKFLKITNQADVISFPGINVDRLTWKIKLNKIILSNYKIIIIHVGTNDIECRSVDEFICYYSLLLKTIKCKNANAIIGISSILPKPCVSDIENTKINSINRNLKKLCGKDKIHFIPSYRPFAKVLKSGSLDLFAVDKLHLSHRGSQVLKQNLIGNIISLQALLKSN